MTYDDSYNNWKNWTKENFGISKRNQISYYNAELKSICKKLNKDSKILEIGYGNGSFLNYADEKGWKIIGIEENQHLHELAIQKGFNSFLFEDLKKLKLNEFNLIVMFDVLEHLKKDELQHLFGLINNLLKPGGVFLSTFPNGDSPFSLYNQNGDLTHETHIGSQAIKFLATNNGFMIDNIRPSAQPMFTGSVLSFFHVLISRPIKWFLNFFVRLIWYPTSPYSYFAANVITVILFKPDKM